MPDFPNGIGMHRQRIRLANATLPLAGSGAEAYLEEVTGSALLVNGCIPVALSKSEGAGSVRILVRLPGAHLYIQVLGNQNHTVDWWSRHSHAPYRSDFRNDQSRRTPSRRFRSSVRTGTGTKS